MLETFAEVFIQAAQPRSAHAAVDAVKRSGLGWVNKLAAGLGHGRSLGVRALLENQIGRNLGSDLSEWWVSGLAVSYQARSGDIDWTSSLRVENISNQRDAGSVIVNEANARFFEPRSPRTWLFSIEGSWR